MAFDPLDGSSIVDTNFTVGTIFGIWPGDKLKDIKGSDQAAAGMGIYGPRTIFCIALKDAPGCHEFLLQDDGKWVHVKETHEIGAQRLMPCTKASLICSLISVVAGVGVACFEMQPACLLLLRALTWTWQHIHGCCYGCTCGSAS